MNRTLIFISILFLLGCYTKKKAQRQFNRATYTYRDEFVKNDTVSVEVKVPVEGWGHITFPEKTIESPDSADWYWSFDIVDTFENKIVDSIFITEVKIVQDKVDGKSFARVKAKTTIPEIEIEHPIQDTPTIKTTIPATIFNTRPSEDCEPVQKLFWWAWLIMIMLTLALIISLIRR